MAPVGTVVVKLHARECSFHFSEKKHDKTACHILFDKKYDDKDPIQITFQAIDVCSGGSAAETIIAPSI